MYMYMSMPLYMSEADIILHVCVELMLNRCTLVTTAYSCVHNTHIDVRCVHTYVHCAHYAHVQCVMQSNVRMNQRLSLSFPSMHFEPSLAHREHVPA